jgi:sugar/nucleoside kinase (ribokinase family)
MQRTFPPVDVCGVGENATDTLLGLPRFPAFNSSMRITSAEMMAGGQVATAMVACQRWGLHTRYFGKVGDDAAGRFQMEQLAPSGVEFHLDVVAQCRSQSAYILIDGSSGERTILFERDERLSHQPGEIPAPAITSARLLHMDGHATAGNAAAARVARAAGIPVTADIDNLYPGHEELLASVDDLVGSHDLAQRLTGIADPLAALPAVAARFGNRLVAATLGSDGVLAYEPAAERFTYCPAFAITPLDTTGAGDLFHAGYVFGRVQGWPLAQILDFSCAAAALNCLALGARGGIRSLAETVAFRGGTPRRPPCPAFTQYNIVEP